MHALTLQLLVPIMVQVSAAAEERTYDIAGVQRQATIILPATPKGAPVVFCFHGHGGNRRQARRSFGFEKQWPEAIVVYMEGLPTKGRTDPQGLRNGWQKNKGEEGDRDLAFFDAVFEDLTKSYRISPSKTFAMGHSNGGRFTYLLWEQRPDRFAAFGPSASPGILMKLPAKPAFIIAGEKDELVTFAGQQATMRQVLRTNGITGSGEKGEGHLTRYAGKNPVQTWVHPGGHRFATDAVPAMAKFFREIAK
ncbi:MAG TPA: prolyl oligopeptidase family serine peptidase [Fimbriimonadaceae bacterium]|nr:prolyl oligopeptidase family serine peptidase [Fimbriimonadaceae bacterium]